MNCKTANYLSLANDNGALSAFIDIAPIDADVAIDVGYKTRGFYRSPSG